jgi:hypothetical protein
MGDEARRLAVLEVLFAARGERKTLLFLKKKKQKDFSRASRSQTANYDT